MKPLLKKFSVILFAALVLFAGITANAVVYQDIIDEITNYRTESVYDIKLNAPFSKDSSGIRETVNPETGSLSMAINLFSVQGRAGEQSIELSLVYDSRVSSAKQETAEYSEKEADYVNTLAEKNLYEQSLSVFGTGWKMHLPYVEKTDERNKTQTYVHLPSGEVYLHDSEEKTGLSEYLLSDLKYVNNKLVYADGTVYQFNDTGYPVKRSDRFENTVNYNWSDEEIPRLTSVKDNSGTAVKFEYSSHGIRITCNDRSYALVLSKQADGEMLLTSVTDPAGRTTFFEYASADMEFNFFSKGENGVNTYHLLQSVTYPSGLKSLYDYETAGKWLYEKNDGFINYARLISRRDTTSDSERDYLHYRYYHSPDGYPLYHSDKLPKSYTYSTTQTDSIGNETAYIYNSSHEQTELRQSSGTQLMSQQQRIFDKTTRMPVRIIESIFNSSGTCMKLYTDVSFDSRGNTIRTDTYSSDESPGTDVCEYGYSDGFNICIYESSMQDKNTKVEVVRTLNNRGTAVASEKLKRNGSTVKTDYFSYDFYGNMTRSSVQTSPTAFLVTEYEYSSQLSSRFPTKITQSNIYDADGHEQRYSTFYEYDLFGNVLKITDKLGAKAYSYDKLNRITRETLEDGLQRVYAYNDIENTISVSDAAGKKLLYSYDEYGKLITVQDLVDKSFLLENKYDKLNRVIAEKNGIGTVIGYEYDGKNRVTGLKITDKNGTVLKRRKIEYNEAYSLKRKTYTKVIVTEGGVPARKTSYLFDRRGYQTEKTILSGSSSRIETTETDFFGNIVKAVSPLGDVTLYKNDVFGNPVTETLPDGSVNTYTYDFNGNCLSFVNAENETYRYNYDSLGRPVSEELPTSDGVSVYKSYYDSRGNVILQTTPTGGRTEYDYNGRGFLTDRREYTSQKDYTLAQYTYDGEGRVTGDVISGTKDAQRTSHTYLLDRYGRVLKETDSLGKTVVTEYDVLGNPVLTVDKRGITTTSIYDGAGRLIETKTDSGQKYTYSYDMLDNLLSVSDAETVYTYQYSGFGELTVAQRGDANDTYSYDGAGRLISQCFYSPNAGTVLKKYSYDKLGRVTAIETPAGTESIEYDKASRIVKKSVSSTGISKSYAYYPGGNVKSIYTYRGNELIFTEKSKYDKSGSRIYSDENGSIKTYRYDIANRLTGVDEGNYRTTEYEFDSLGNISREYEIIGGNISETQYFYDSANRLIMKSGDELVRYEYDESGSLTKKTEGSGSNTKTSYYKYDGWGRLISFYNGSDTAVYSYNPEGLRSEKTVNGSVTRFYYDNGDIIGTVTDGVPTIYARGSELIAKLSGSDMLIYRNNQHGDVTALFNPLGEQQQTYSYTAYGEERTGVINPLGNNTVLYRWQAETQTDENPFRYCGEYVDLCSGLIYLRNRYYDPSIGRFITEDPARDGLNWYIYANNNPVNYIDPRGLAPTKEEAAAMADHIYDWEKDSARSDRTVAGWRLIDVWYGRESMKMGIYIKDSDDWQNPSEYALVFRGSIIQFNTETIDVWKNNAEQFLSAKSADMWDAINYSVGFTNSHSQEITFIGHSKGGAEALAAAVATGKNAIVFNPAKPNLRDYNLSAGNYNGNATSYVVRGEILNNLFGEPGVGRVEYLNQKYKTPRYFVGDARKIANIVNPIRNHLMEAVLSGI